MDRRRFLATSAGMATAFLAMNKVFGPIFNVSEAEAADKPDEPDEPEADAGVQSEEQGGSK